jgi:hypothetical protein
MVTLWAIAEKKNGAGGSVVAEEEEGDEQSEGEAPEDVEVGDEVGVGAHGDAGEERDETLLLFAVHEEAHAGAGDEELGEDVVKVKVHRLIIGVFHHEDTENTKKHEEAFEIVG